MLTDLFDSLSTFIGVAQAANLVDEKGEPKNLRQGLIVDAFATLGAGLFGSSSGTAYVESIAGIRMGGRTGLTAVVTAFCFLPCLFIAPLAGGDSRLRDVRGADPRRRLDVPGGDARAVRSARDRGAGVCHADPDSADLFHHARYSLGVHPARGAARRGGTGPRGRPRRPGAWPRCPSRCWSSNMPTDHERLSDPRRSRSTSSRRSRSSPTSRSSSCRTSSCTPRSIPRPTASRC